MPNLNVTNNANETDPYSLAQVEESFTSIETWANVTKLDGDNIQNGAIGSDQLAGSAVISSKIATAAVETAKIADLGVTTGKINDLAVTTGKINDLAVTTGKINDAAVTQAKRAALGQQVSSSSSTFSTASSSFTDVTNLTVTITTTGRAVFVGTIADPSIDGSSDNCYYRAENNTGTAYSLQMGVKILQGSSTILATLMSPQDAKNGYFPPGCIWTIDVPSAGTYTYKVQIKATNANFVHARNMKLIAYEL